jgi:hypothetical protein
MKCQICEKEFNPVRKNQACCSNECKKEKERRWQADHYQKIKGTRVLTEEQIESNRVRNRNRYRNMDPEKKKQFLAEKRRKYQESQEGE